MNRQNTVLATRISPYLPNISKQGSSRIKGITSMRAKVYECIGADQLRSVSIREKKVIGITDNQIKIMLNIEICSNIQVKEDKA